MVLKSEQGGFAMAGVPEGIGPIGSLAPSPGAGPGRIVGMRSASNVLGRSPEAVESLGAMRDFNDRATGAVLGADEGALAVGAV
jgi:hypothetical protein